MLRAAIDIGSNSVRLMVARVDGSNFMPLDKRIDTTRLHEGLDADNMLSEESMRRTLTAINTFADIARKMGVDDAQISVFATSAVRDAANGDEFLRRAKLESGVTVRLLSGAEEADYAFFAAARPGYCGVIDIGGASTEMICGRDFEVLRSYSAQMGAVRLRKMLGDGATKEAMLQKSADVLKPGLDSLGDIPKTFVGVAGTITTLYALKIGLKEYSAEAVQGGYISRAEVADWLDRLYDMTIDERQSLPGMPLRRAEIIDFGAAILLSFLTLAGLEGIFVSDRDNLYSGIMI